MANKEKSNVNCLPEKILDDIFEYTKHKGLGGFLICYITESGEVAISQRFSSSFVRLALIKGIEEAIDQEVLDA